MLQERLLPFTDDQYAGDFVFQQDNAPAHSAQHTNDFFLTEGIDVLPWPAISPDLNCIENCWGELSRKLYARNRQFDSTEHLMEALYYEWDNLDLTYIRTLIKSMPDRVRECRNERGGVTKY